MGSCDRVAKRLVDTVANLVSVVDELPRGSRGTQVSAEPDGAVPGTTGGHVTVELHAEAMTSIAEAIVAANDTVHVPVTFDSCEDVEGPFFHGTRMTFDVGDHVVPGRLSNYHEGRISNHVYFAALLEPAVWAAELAVALAGSEGRGRLYVVEPEGPFEDDPNVTNKKFPGNVTRSYRTRHPMRVVGEVQNWEGHSPDVLRGMLENITRLRDQLLDVIED